MQRGEILKKFINKPDNMDTEAARGMALAKPNILRQLPGCNVMVRQNKKQTEWPWSSAVGVAMNLPPTAMSDTACSMPAFRGNSFPPLRRT